MLCYVLACYAMMVYYVVLCYVILCYIPLWPKALTVWMQERSLLLGKAARRGPELPESDWIPSSTGFLWVWGRLGL